MDNELIYNEVESRNSKCVPDIHSMILNEMFKQIMSDIDKELVNMCRKNTKKLAKEMDDKFF